MAPGPLGMERDGHHGDVQRAHARRLLGGEDDVAVVGQDDDLVGAQRPRPPRAAAPRSGSWTGRRRRWRGSRARGRAALLPSPATTATTTVPPSATSGAAASRSSRARVCSCMSLISTSPMAPCLSASLSTTPGSLVCTCTLTHALVADHQGAVADGQQERLEGLAVDALARDEEARAVAVLGELARLLDGDRARRRRRPPRAPRRLRGGASGERAPATTLPPRMSSSMPAASPRNRTSRP